MVEMAKTVNGKLVNKEFNKEQRLDCKLDNIVEQIDKLEQLSVQNLQSHQTEILALKSLNQELNTIETNRVDSIQKSFRFFERQISRKLIFLVSIVIFGCGSFSVWFISKNQNSFCQAQYRVESSSKLLSFF